MLSYRVIYWRVLDLQHTRTRLTRWPLWNRYNRVARGRDKIFILLIIIAAAAAYTTRLNVFNTGKRYGIRNERVEIPIFIVRSLSGIYYCLVYDNNVIDTTLHVVCRYNARLCSTVLRVRFS